MMRILRSKFIREKHSVLNLGLMPKTDHSYVSRVTIA